MTDMLIRPTTPTDIPYLPTIERSAARAFCSIPSLAWLAESAVISEAAHARFQAKGCSWVAVQSAKPVAFILAEIADNALFIVELSVEREWQGQGIGRQLLSFVTEIARSQGLRELTLTTFCEVPWNAPFYARLGFERLAESELSPALRSQLDEEAAHGLPRDSRCAMRLKL